MSKRSVFVSYSNRDAKWATQVQQALERLGLHATNTSHDLRVGDDWRKAVQTAMRKSDALVLLMTSPYASSSWMQYEAGMAEALGKRVMVLLPKRYPVAELPADLASGQVVQFDPQAPEQAAQDIATRLAAA